MLWRSIGITPYKHSVILIIIGCYGCNDKSTMEEVRLIAQD